MLMIAGLKTYCEYKLVCRKPGRPGGFEYHFTEDQEEKMFSRKEYYEKRGFIVTMKQRRVTEWEEVVNACRDDD